MIYKQIIIPVAFLVLLSLFVGAKTLGDKQAVVSTNTTLGISEEASASPSSTPSPSLTTKLTTVTSTYKGTYAYLGSSSTVTLYLPQNGSYLGSVDGSCVGGIAGKRDGNKLTGGATGKCRVGLVDVPSEASFEGTLSGNTININFKGKAGVFNHSDSMVLQKI